ncbi:hypothetical protein M8J77_002850 [Diaphorina citri]|nr:hypothetical protein M8J77_002850 [Diaphorina citri]
MCIVKVYNIIIEPRPGSTEKLIGTKFNSLVLFPPEVLMTSLPMVLYNGVNMSRPWVLCFYENVQNGMFRVLLMLFVIRAAKANMSCESARIKCAYREGCAEALQNYMIGCSQAFHGSTALNYCPETCQLALIALTSTEVGKELMNVSIQTILCKEPNFQLLT